MFFSDFFCFYREVLRYNVCGPVVFVFLKVFIFYTLYYFEAFSGELLLKAIAGIEMGIGMEFIQCIAFGNKFKATGFQKSDIWLVHIALREGISDRSDFFLAW